MKVLITLTCLLLCGCAGVASYSIKPFYDPISQRVICCEANVTNGKDIASITVDVSKTGDNYALHLHERGVNASSPIEEQSKTVSSVAGAVSNVAETAAKLIK